MQRITSVDPATATGKAKELMDAIKSQVGFVPNLYRIVAHTPEGLAGVLGLSAALSKGTLDAATRERIALAVANVNGCDYCNAAHTAIAKGHKLDEAEIQANRSGHSSDSKAEVAVALARKIAVTRANLTENDLAVARAVGYSEAQIVEIVLNVAANVLTNYVNEVFKTEIDFPATAPATRAA